MAAQEAMLGRCVMETLETRQLLTVAIPLLNQDFQSPMWVQSGSSWVQETVPAGTQISNSNQLDPRFGPPGFGKTAVGGGGGIGPNGEGLYSERNDLGYNQYFDYTNGSLPSPASGVNFFCIQPSTGYTYTVWVDQQTNSTGDAGNHSDLIYPPMIPATFALANHEYQVTVALGNPLVNGSTPQMPATVQLDLTLGAGTYNEPSNTNSYLTAPQPGDTSLYYNGYGTTVASATAASNDPNWQLAPGTFQDLTVTWTCPSWDAGQPLDVQFVFSCGSADVCMSNIVFQDLTALPYAPPPPTGVTAYGTSSSQINLDWGLEPAANSFNVYESTTSGQEGTTPIATGITGTSYSVTGLNPSTNYYFTVAAVNSYGAAGSQSSQVSAMTGSTGTPVAVTVPDGGFTDATGYYIDSSGYNGGNGTFTSPMTGTLSGWALSAAPSTANGGYYNYGGWNPFGVLDSVTSSGASPYGNNSPYLGSQPASSYNEFMYYPGEQWPSNGVVTGAQPGASLTMTTTGITATAVTNTTYTATIDYANASWSNCAANASANVNLNILANGTVVSTTPIVGLAEGTPWTTVTAGWVCPAAYAGETIQIQAVASNFLEGPSQWEVPAFAFANATLSTQAPATPAAPSNLTATGVSQTQINLTWLNNAGNQSGFTIERATNSTFTANTATFTAAATATSYSDTSVTDSNTYYYEVCAMNSYGSSAYSASACVPAAPSNLTATATAYDQINLTWQNNSTSQTGLIIERATNSTFTANTGTFTAAATATSYSDMGVAGSTLYYYKVCATATGGTSVYSNSANATTPVGPPAAPSNLAATAPSPTQINLSWTNNASNQTGFTIERATNSTFTANTATFTAAATATSYSDTSVTDSNTYYYEVCATNGNGSSTYSASACVPAAPSNLTATATAYDQINLAWQNNSTSQTGLTIERATNSTFTQNVATFTATASATSYSDTSVAGGTLYYYEVCATATGGASVYSNSASATTPTAVVISVPNSSFASPAQSSGGYSNNVVTNWTIGTTPGNYTAGVQNNTSAWFSSMEAGTTQFAYVNADSNSSYYNSSDTLTSAALGTVGGSQTYTLTVGLGNRLDNPLADNGTYTISLLDGGTVLASQTYAGSSIAVGTWYDLSLVYTTPANVAAGNLQVQLGFATAGYTSGNVWGQGDFDNVRLTTTVSAVPAAPSNLAATATSQTQINLTWTNNASNQTGFTIERATNSTFTANTATFTAAASATSYSDTSVTDSNTYYYEVCATNGNGSSAYSASACVPAAPSNLTATAAAYNQINLTWQNNATGQTGFTIERPATNSTFTQNVATFTAAASATSYSDMSVAGSTLYYYEVCATATGGASVYSNSASATTPIAPSGTSVAISVPNSSFASPAQSSGGYSNNAVTNWTIGTTPGVYTAGVQNNTAAWFSSMEAGTTQFAFINADSNSSYYNSSDTLTSAALGTVGGGQTYTLTVGLGNRLDSPLANNGTYTISLLDGGTVVASQTYAGSSIAVGTWYDLSVTYTTPANVATGSLQAQLGFTTAGYTSGNPGGQGDFDNVRLTLSPTTLTSVSVANSSFASPAQSSGGYSNNSVANWTIATTPAGCSAGVQNNTSAYFSTMEGGTTQFAFINTDSNNSMYNSSDTLTSAALGTVVGGATYTLTVGLGNRLDSPLADNGTYTISLLDGATVLASQTYAGSSIAVGTWYDLALAYTTPTNVAAGNLEVQLGFTTAGYTSGNPFGQGDFDNVRLTTSVQAATVCAAPSGSMTVNGNTWSWGSTASGGWNILENGSSAGSGTGVAMFNNNGTIWAVNSSGSWSYWTGSAWSASTPVAVGYSPLAAATSGALTVGSNAWSWGSSASGGWTTLQNGSAAGGGSGVAMFNDNGTVWLVNNSGGWYYWNGSAWVSSTLSTL